MSPIPQGGEWDTRMWTPGEGIAPALLFKDTRTQGCGHLRRELSQPSSSSPPLCPLQKPDDWSREPGGCRAGQRSEVPSPRPSHLVRKKEINKSNLTISPCRKNKDKNLSITRCTKDLKGLFTFFLFSVRSNILNSNGVWYS